MIIALDFDGVLYDGGNECLLVAWNTFYKNNISYFNQSVLNDIPDKFKEVFKNSRNYVRHDGHFIVPFYMNYVSNIDYEGFEKVYNDIPESVKSEFKNNFYLYRKIARNKYPSFWVELHTELINLKDILSLGPTVTISIVSGKDSDSIAFILHHAGINLPNERIFGRLKNKEPILLSLSNEAKDNGEILIFIDDNINNVIDSLKIGIDSLWAKWGYHTELQEKLAMELSLKVLTKESIFPVVKEYIINNDSLIERS